MPLYAIAYRLSKVYLESLQTNTIKNIEKKNFIYHGNSIGRMPILFVMIKHGG